MIHDIPELLLYWIRERESVRKKKEAGGYRPWSEDSIFRSVYFCNVRREDDKITKYIRKMYTPYYAHPMFTYNIIFSRFINNIETLGKIGFLTEHDPEALKWKLEELALKGRVWGNAYVITTHGIPMAKATYLCDNVLDGAFEARLAIEAATRPGTSPPTLHAAHAALMQLEGLGSFLAAQVVADLKNTAGHPLWGATDWWTFVASGPGSERGVAWFKTGDCKILDRSNWKKNFMSVRAHVELNWTKEMGLTICNQDLQNCLCEFDKYMRVLTGSGRSKRSYPGA